MSQSGSDFVLGDRKLKQIPKFAPSKNKDLKTKLKMNKSLPSFPGLFVCFVILLSGCAGKQTRMSQTRDTRNHLDLSTIASMAMTKPYEVLAMIDSSYEAGDLSPFMAQLYRTNIYYNPLQEDAKVIECATDALSMDTEELTDRHRVLLLKLMSKSYYLTGEYGQSLNAAMEGEKIAESMDSIAAQGEFRFITGECMLKLGQDKPAFANMEYGVAALSREKGFHARSTLSHLLGEEMNFMIEDGRYDEAIATGQMREILLDGIAAEFGDRGCLDQQFGYLYGKMAFLFMKKGDRIKAGSYASKFNDTYYSKEKNGRLRILEYCLEAGRFEEALDIIGDTDFPASGDTISFDGQYYLELKAEALNGAGRYEEAYQLLRRSSNISGILEKNTDKERALKVSDMFRTHEAEMKVKESEAREARYLLYLIAILAVCIMMALCFFLYYNKTKSIMEKNRLIDIGRTDTEKYMRLLQSAQARIRELDPKETVQDKSSEADSWQLFLKLEDAMDKDKLFLDKTITRADILELLGISKNRLGKMFQDIGGDLSLPTYINGKRLNHALGIIAEHPDYTVNEIADASGFSNTRNFHLLFKKRFGITPLQYRNGK